MIELILGAVIGGIVSLIVSEVYHRRAAKELNDETTKLKKVNAEIVANIDSLLEIQEDISEKTETIFKHSVAGTPDDPDYPYK